MKKQIAWVDTILIRGLPVFIGLIFFITSLVIVNRYGFSFIQFSPIRENEGFEIIFNLGIWYVIIMKSIGEFFNNLKLEYKNSKDCANKKNKHKGEDNE